MIPFSITCTTCQSRLTVNSEEALGQILQCPKCNSMVAVPDATVPPDEAATTNQASPSAPPISDSGAETVDHYDSSDISRLIDHPTPPTSGEDQAWEGETPPESMTQQESDAQPMLPTDDWASAGSRQIRQRVLIGGLITICLVTIIAIVYVLNDTPEEEPAIISSKPPEQNPEQTAELPPNQSPVEKPSDIVEEPAPAEPPVPEEEKNNQEEEPKNPVPPTEPPGLTAEPVNDEAEQADAAELSQLLQEFSPLLSDTPFDEPTTAQPDASSTLPTTKISKPPLRRISVKNSLDFAIAEFTTENPITLHAFLKQVSTLSGIPFEIDLNALASRNVTLDLPVTIELKQTTVAQLLQAVLEPHGLGFVESDQTLTISYLPKAETQLIEATYPVADLVGTTPQQATDLIEWLQALVAPSSWTTDSSDCMIKIQNNQLQIRHLPTAQYEVFRLLTRLRMARKLEHPESSDKRIPTISLTPSVDQADKILNEPITLNFTRSTPLLKILEHIEQQRPVKFVLNGRTLRQCGWAAYSDATLATDNETLQQSLKVLLAPMELTARTIDANTIEITSLQDELTRREVEFYRVDHLLQKNRTPEQLIELIKQKIGADRFTDDQIDQQILFDPTSKYLMIRESQPNHRKLSYLLSSG